MCTLHCLLQVDRKDCKWILRSWTLLLKQKQEAAKEQPHQDHLRKTFLEERNPNVNTNVNCNTNFNILRKNMKKYGEGRQEMKIKARLISSFFANWKHKALFKLGEKTTCENTCLNKLKGNWRASNVGSWEYWSHEALQHIGGQKFPLSLPKLHSFFFTLFTTVTCYTFLDRSSYSIFPMVLADHSSWH